MRKRAFGYALLLLSQFLLGGCYLLGATATETYGDYQTRAERGEVAPLETVRACSREATVRGPDGRWVYDQSAYDACLKRAGW